MTGWCGQRFKDTETEKAYAAFVAYENAKIRKKLTYIFLALYTCMIVIHMWSVKFELSWPSVLELSTGGFALLAFWMAPARYLEYTHAAASVSIVMAVLSLNVFRLKHMNLIDVIPDTPYNMTVVSLDLELSILLRDVIHIWASLLLQVTFCASLRVRTNISRIVPVLSGAWYALLSFLPDLRPKEAFYFELAIVIFYLFLLGSFGVWYLSYLDESRHRSLWALNRKREAETVWQHEFVETVFPIILRVKEDRIEPACTSFGQEVSRISEILSRNDRGDFTPELEKIVKEVESAAQESFYLATFAQKCHCTGYQ
jgi:hypothetical protein